MSDSLQFAIVIGILFISHLLIAYIAIRGMKRDGIEWIARMEQDWAAERKDLLDRIQAPSFADYTNKVVREKKAEQKPEEKEQPIEFIS